MNPGGVIAFLNSQIGRYRHITAQHFGQLVASDNELVFGDRLARVAARLAHAQPIDTNEAGRASAGIGVAGFIDGVSVER